MANLNLNGNVSKNEETLQLAHSNLITFGKLFSPQDFLASATPDFHIDVGKMLIDKSNQQLALVLPRDHAKSTLAATAVLHRFLFATKDRPEFIAWIGEAQDQARDNLNWISNHIYSNPAIHYYFGDLQGDKWTKDEFTLSNGCRMIGKGTSQRLRGKKQLSTRYTGIILDDFESELNTKTPDSRRQIKEWVTAAVYPAIDFDKDGFLWCNGTIVHYDSFLNGLVKGSQEAKNTGEEYAWKVFTRKALEDGKPIWPSRWPVKKLEERKQFYIDSGTPAKFYQEYMNQANHQKTKYLVRRIYKMGFIRGMRDLMKRLIRGIYNLLMGIKNTLIYILVLTQLRQLLLGVIILLLWCLVLLPNMIIMLLSIGAKESYPWNVPMRYLKSLKDTRQSNE